MYWGSLSWAMYKKQLSAQMLQWAQWDKNLFILPFFRFSNSLIFFVSIGFVSWFVILVSLFEPRKERIYAFLTIFELPSSTPANETVFASDEETVQEEKEHMSQFRKRERDKHDLSCEDM
jgi:hypothetical protein